MLEKKDFQKIGKIVEEKTEKVRKDLKGDIGQVRKELKSDMAQTRKELKSDIEQSSNALGKELRQDIEQNSKNLVTELGEVIEQNIMPVMDGMQKDIDTIKKTMVTKIHFNERLDEKLADLRGDIVILLRKEDRKLEALIEKLKAKHVITDNDVKELHEIQIFAQ